MGQVKNLGGVIMAKKNNDEQNLTEKEVAKTYEVVAHFETGSGQTFDPNPSEPVFVFESDFEPADWKKIVESGAVSLAAPPVELKDDETIVFEKVDETQAKVVLRKIPRKKR